MRLTMEMRTVTILAACLAAALPFSTPARAQSKNGDFSQITHERTLTFMTRDHQCTRGTIDKTDAQAVTVQQQGATTTKTFLKKDLLFVGENFQSRNILLSGRSSWYDVTNDLPEAHEHFLITLKSGEKISESKVKASAVTLALGSGRHPRVIAKPEIATLEYVRYLPFTDRVADENQGLNFFQPTFYREKLGHMPTIAVKLYDVTLPQDDTALYCK